MTTAGDDKTLRLWDLFTAQERLTLKGHTDSLWCLAFSPDGRILTSASADGAVNLWEAAKDEETVIANAR